MSTDDRIKQALTCIDKALDSINTNESWLEYLRFQSLFYRYSAQNTMLIYSQRPEASFVMGYKSWNKIGRYVVKGGQAIKILAPCYKKVDSIVEPKDDNKYFDAEAEHEIKKVLSGFKVANVFDIQDTAGDDSRLPILITGLKGDTEEIVFKDFENSTEDHSVFYNVRLIPEYEGYGKNVKSKFYIKVVRKDENGDVLSTIKVGTPDFKRKGISSYKIDKIFTDASGKSLVFIVQKKLEDNTGTSIRYMVETYRF